MDNPPNYITKSEATTTNNSHQHYINKTFNSTDAIVKTITYSDYKTDNNLVFSGPGLGLANRSLVFEEEKCKIHNEERYGFSHVYACLRGQFSDCICASKSGNKLDCLKITIQITEGGGRLWQPLGSCIQYERDLTTISSTHREYNTQDVHTISLL